MLPGIAFAVMDGDITVVGSTGVAGNWKIHSFPRNEPLGEDLKSSLTIKPFSLMADYTVSV